MAKMRLEVFRLICVFFSSLHLRRHEKFLKPSQKPCFIQEKQKQIKSPYFSPSTYPDINFFKKSHFCLILYSENTSRLNRLILLVFLPSTYAEINFQIDDYFCLILQLKNHSCFFTEGKSVSIFLPPTQTLIFKIRAIITLLYMEKIQVSEIRRSRLFSISLPPMTTLKIFFNAVICHKIYSLNEV